MGLIPTSSPMMWLPSLPTSALIFGVLFVAGYLLVRAAYPKPIPGIPCVSTSTRRLLGDLPDALKYQAKTNEFLSFLRTRALELDSPVIQVFLRPFRKPWVVVCDSQEAQDILTHRTREFDRSDFFREIFSAAIPTHHGIMRTNDEWRLHRSLISDLVSPSFLATVVAPFSHDGASRLTNLWEVKRTLAAGRPFDAALDIDEMMLDTIFAQVFGDSESITEVQTQLLSKDRRLDDVSINVDVDEAIAFPRAPWPKTKTAVYDIAASSSIAMRSPLGRWHHKFAMRFYPGLNAAARIKNQLVQKKLDYAWEKFNNAESASDDDIKCATDLVVQREVKAAQRVGRKAAYDSPVMQDEVFGLLAAGHDTTGSTLQWALKLLTANQVVQQRLRSDLRTIFAQADEDGRAPTAEELCKTRLPYLDAVVHEILRCVPISQASIRVATTNTEILGHQIPAGTDVFMVSSGPGYLAPPFPVEGSRRSKTSQESGEKTWSGNWDASDLDKFLPERWLSVDDKGETEFDARAGPMHTFGGGIRGCFGRKIATLTMRVVVALVVWKFELKPLPSQCASMTGTDKLSYRPQHMYVRLEKVEAEKASN